MALVHNAMIRGSNSIYQQAPYIDDELSSDFVQYSLTWASFVTSHHHDEEDNLFDKVSDLLRDKTVWAETHKEHEAFIDGVVQFEAHLKGLSKSTELSADALLRITDSFRAPLDRHLHSEVQTIAALAAHPRAPVKGSGAAAAAALVFKTWGKKTVTKAGMLDVVPFFFLNLDRTFEKRPLGALAAHAGAHPLDASQRRRHVPWQLVAFCQLRRGRQPERAAGAGAAC